MRKVLIFLMGLTAIMSCSKSNEAGYIGQSQIVIEDGVMTAETLLAFGRISDPQLSPDGKLILYTVGYNSIEDNRSCRNLFVCKTDGSERVQLTRYAQSVSNARWSKDGSKIRFIQGGQIKEVEFKGKSVGKRVQLSDVPSGISEFKLSPDECQIIYVSSIRNELIKTPADSGLDKAQAYATESLMYRHWDHWVTEIPRSYVAPFAGAMITPDNSYDILGTDEMYELPTEPFGGVEQLAWAPDSRHIAYSCRKKTGKEYAFSTNSSIYIHDVTTGVTVVLPETATGGYDTEPAWSEDGQFLAWISMERDGYEADQQRLMVCPIHLGDEVTFDPAYQLASSLDRDAAGIFWKGNEIFFNALVSEGVQAIFCADLKGEYQRVTAADWKYDFNSPFAILESEEGVKLLASYCSLNFPTELVAVNITSEGASFSPITTENEHILKQLDEPSSESVLVETTDHKNMQCWILYPPHFDPSKKYPAIEIVLGGPQGTNSQGWSYRWNYRLMAQQGYIVMMPNRRGTTAFGQEWKEQISGDYPGLNMLDYLSAGKYMKSLPYVDKLACVGASYGGYSAYMLEGLHGDLFDCFISHAGIFNEEQLWFTTEEMWFANWDNGGLTEYAYREGEQGPAKDGITFGGMQQAGAPYASTPKAKRHYAHSPKDMITRWHTPILCIHGMMDFRIPYEQGMAAFNAAQMMGVPSKLLIFPEENHWILQPQNSLFWHREFYDWLSRWM